MNLSVIKVSVGSFLLYPDEPFMKVVHHGRIIKQKLRMWFNTEENLVSFNIICE